MAQLRKHLGSNLLYKVIKNTIALKASVDTPVSVAQKHLKGQVGIAVGYDDPVELVKKVISFSKKNEKLRLSAGVIEGRLYTDIDLKEIAELPSKQVLLSMLAGVMQAPLGKLAGGLSATLSSFAHAMNALATQKTT